MYPGLQNKCLSIVDKYVRFVHRPVVFCVEDKDPVQDKEVGLGQLVL